MVDIEQTETPGHYGDGSPPKILYKSHSAHIDREIEEQEKQKILEKQEKDLLNALLLNGLDADTTTSDKAQSVVKTEKNIRKRPKAWIDDDDVVDPENEEDTQRNINIRSQRLSKILQKTVKESYLNKEEYQERVEETFTRKNKNPTWNQSKKLTGQEKDSADDNSDYYDSDDELQTSGIRSVKSRKFLKKNSNVLDLTNFDIRKCSKDVQISSTRFKASAFHPTKPLFGVISSDSKRVNIAEIDGQENKMVGNSINFFDENSYGNSVCFDSSSVLGGGYRSGRKMPKLQNNLNSKSKLVDLFFGKNQNSTKLFTLSNFVNKRDHNRVNCNILCHDLVTGVNQNFKNVRGLDSLASHRFTPSPNRDFIALHNNQPATQVSIASLKNNNDLQIVNSFRQGSKIIDMQAFSTLTNEFGLAILNRNNEISIWDMKYSKRCVSSIKCDQIMRATRLAVNQDGSRFAVGGHTGYVSLYDLNEDYSGRDLLNFNNDADETSNSFQESNTNLKPVKEFSNLTTAINSLEFSRINQTDILAFSSNSNWMNQMEISDSKFVGNSKRQQKENTSKDNQGTLKIAHCGMKQVFSNFPSFKDKNELGIIQDLKFSPGGKFMVVQNSRGRLPIFSLGHRLVY